MNKQAKEMEALSSDIEKFLIRGTKLFGFVDKQTDEKPRFSNSFVENRLGIPATTHNLRTINNILDLV
jgi:hypothetical protein